MADEQQLKKLSDYIQPKPLTPSQIIVGILIVVLLFFLVVWILQICWNASIPNMFSGAKEISYAVAFYFMIVVLIVFPRRIM